MSKKKKKRQVTSLQIKIYCYSITLSFVTNFMILIGFDLFTERFSNIGILTSVFNISTVSRHLLEKMLKINKGKRKTF